MIGLPPLTPRALYHYTCGHAAQGIGLTVGYLHPHEQPVLGGVILTWLTDLDEPDVLALGLESTILTCDRTAFQYVTIPRWVPEGAITWWPRARRYLPAAAVAELETEGRQPEHWWVASMPIPVTLTTWP